MFVFPEIPQYSQSMSLLDRGIKRAFDLILSGAGLILFSPIIVAISLAIKLVSHGPVFITQTRYGYNNQIVHVLTFRSSTTDVSSRITRIGDALRGTGINELLQFVNVLRGEMSIVGPRLNTTANKMSEGQLWPLSCRHIKPGIIGSAQSKDDLYYIDNWSLLLDAKIIFRTIFARKSYTRNE